MSQKLLQKDIKQLLDARQYAPRDVLGFHEFCNEQGFTEWLIRVYEPEAISVTVVWDLSNTASSDAIEHPLKQVHADGLFELRLQPLPKLQPYKLRIDYRDGNQELKYDPYYFSAEISDFDLFLFAEGNHHQIFRKLGAHITEYQGVQGTRFAVWAPNAERVSVVGAFNYWDGRKHLMQSRGASGVWELFIPGVAADALYKYEIKSTHNGNIYVKSDPYGFAMQLRPDNASCVADLTGYEWQDQAWMQQRLEQDALQQPVNIYEVHPGSWRKVPAENNRFLNYAELAAELIPYVKEMGYTHIELMGLAEHPLDASWGYQVTGYYAPTARYGKPKDLMAFIDECHQAGIGVIMDWVPAHFPKDDNALCLFDGTPLYEHADDRIGEHKDWGTKIFNYGRNEVRNFLIANAVYWLDYYHIDGLRVDAVASMLYLDYSREEGEWLPNKYGGRENLEAITFIKSLNETIFHYFPGILSIAEESTAFTGVSHPTYLGGLGFNLKWNMGWMNDSLKYIQQDPIYRQYDGQLLTFSMVYAFSEQYVLPISHDEVVHGKQSLLSKMPGDDWQKRANYRAYLTYKLGHPGKKLLFMGSEWGQWQEWDVSQSLPWDNLQSPFHSQLQAFCKSLNHLYLAQPALYRSDFDHNGFEWIDFHDYQNCVYSFMRWDTQDQSYPRKPLIFIFNFTPVPRDNYAIGVPFAGRYIKVLDSDNDAFGGSAYNQQQALDAQAIECHNRPYSLSLNLPPLSALILTTE